MQESQESERQRTFLPLHASSLPFPAFHLRCRVPKISKLAASFLPRPPLKLSHCDEWSLRCDWERRCFLSVPVEVAVASVFLRRAKFFALHICGSVCVWTGFLLVFVYLHICQRGWREDRRTELLFAAACSAGFSSETTILKIVQYVWMYKSCMQCSTYYVVAMIPDTDIS